jgi:hypothetical protein
LLLLLSLIDEGLMVGWGPPECLKQQGLLLMRVKLVLLLLLKMCFCRSMMYRMVLYCHTACNTIFLPAHKVELCLLFGTQAAPGQLKQPRLEPCECEKKLREE